MSNKANQTEVEPFNGTEVAVVGEETGLRVHAQFSGEELIEAFKNSSNEIFSSIPNDGSRQVAIRLFNAVSNTDKDIADMIGETIEMVDIIAFPTQLADEKTGELFSALTTIIIDKDDISYRATSIGVTNALQKIFAFVSLPQGDTKQGKPSWREEPVKVKIVQEKTKNGNNKVNTLKMV